MYDTLVTVIKEDTTLNGLNERTGDYIKVGSYWATKTEQGGREDQYASRIVHENEVVLSTRYSPAIEPGMMLIYGEDRADKNYNDAMPITSVHTEGRRKKTHIICLKSDAQN